MLGMFRDLQYERKINEPIASVSGRTPISSLLVTPAFDMEWERRPVLEEAI